MTRSAHDRQDEPGDPEDVRAVRGAHSLGLRIRVGALTESVLDLTDNSLEAAHAAVARAYADARRLVYDRLPSGPVDATQLDEEQQRALSRLAAVERRLEELRRAVHDDPANVPSP
jgi:hypothetical protein